MMENKILLMWHEHKDVLNMEACLVWHEKLLAGHYGESGRSCFLKKLNSSSFLNKRGGSNGIFMHGWPSVGHSQLLIKEAILMRIIDNLIRRTERPPAVAVCVVVLLSQSQSASHILLFFSSCLCLTVPHRGDHVFPGTRQQGVWLFSSKVCNEHRSEVGPLTLHTSHRPPVSSSWGSLSGRTGLPRHTNIELVGIWARVAPRERQAAEPH